MTPETTFIYVLVDPDTNEVRYVGKANDPQRRLREHLRKTVQDEDCHRTRWINSLKERGLTPRMEVIEEVSFEQWPERERHWIEHYRNQGCRLTNTFEGGIGPGTHASETRAKIGAAHKGKSPSRKRSAESYASEEWKDKTGRANKGKKHSPETLAKLSAMRTGTKRSPETRAKMAAAQLGKKRPELSAAMQGRKLSEETKAKLSAANKGKKLSPESIEKRSAKQRGRKHSPESIEKMAASKRGVKRAPYSEEWRQKLSEATKKRHEARRAQQASCE